MPVSVVVGGQFGSEGKGKVAHAFAQKRNASVVVRVGGPNSGHTAIDRAGRYQVLRQLPTGALLDEPICLIPSGAYIDVDVLLGEIQRVGLPAERLVIDPNAFVISDEDKAAEARGGLRDRIGSTQSGTGAAVVKRIQRLSRASLAQNDPRLERFVAPATSFLRSRLKKGELVLIEGTQGFGLSLLHSKHYPYGTSRDTTASAFVSEAGLSPLDVDEVVLVIRAFPIRVPGNSGPLPNEVDWSIVTQEAASSEAISELTSVTATTRRVARFDADIVIAAIEANAPTQVVLNHIDYFDAQCQATGELSSKAEIAVSVIEKAIGRRVDYCGVGPSSLLVRATSDPKTLLHDVAKS